MSKFKGFSPGKATAHIPDDFFTELLPHIKDLDELKLTLFTFWAVAQMDETSPYLTAEDFEENGFGEGARQAAVKRGTLLHATAGETNLYFVNSLAGKNAVDAIKKGDWQPTGNRRKPASLPTNRPNIFRLYEQHIGSLTPMMSDRLQDAETEYPPEWIEEALRIAVENNIRNWRYVQAILDRWQREGRHDRTDQGNLEPDYKKYLGGEFSEFIKN